jgi:hypothetical protein
MTLSLTHTKVSGKSDGGDATLVQPSDWNDEHDLTLAAGKIMGRDTSGAGAVQELPLSFDASGNADFTAAQGGLGVPTGTTGQRLGGARNGVFRYNTTLGTFEGMIAGVWTAVLGAVSPAITGTASLVNATLSGLLQIVGLSETVVAADLTDSVLTMDLSLGTNFTITRTSAITSIVFSNKPAGKVASATLWVKSGDGVAHADDLSSCQWAGNSPPTLGSVVNNEDVIGFIIRPSVTKPYAFLGGLGFGG